MFSRIVRSLFVVACTITGGMWASFLLNAYIEHANIQYADENPPSASDTSQRGTTLRPPKATPAEQGKVGAAGVAQTAPGENDSVVPDKVEIPGTPSKNLKYVDQNIVPKHFVPFIISIGGLCGLLVAFFITFALRFVTQEAFERFFPALVSVLLALAVGMLLAWYIVQVMGIRDQTLQDLHSGHLGHRILLHRRESRPHPYVSWENLVGPSAGRHTKAVTKSWIPA